MYQWLYKEPLRSISKSELVEEQIAEIRTRIAEVKRKEVLARVGMAGAILITVAILSCFLGGCTFVSSSMLPGINYRENPKVQVVEYDSIFDLQVACIKQHKVPGY